MCFGCSKESFLKSIVVKLTTFYISYMQNSSILTSFGSPAGSGIFLSLIWGQISAPSKILKWAKTSQNGVYHSQFLSSKFWWKFMKILTKIAKLQIHENLHKNVNENMFSFTFLCKFSWVLWRAIKATNMWQLYTANFNLFKMATEYQFAPILMVQRLFPHIQQAPGPNFRTVGKSLRLVCILLGLNPWREIFSHWGPYDT